MTKKVLILVMSSPSIEVYNEMMKKQKETWDSIQVENVNTLFFYGDDTVSETHISENNLILKTQDTTLNNLYKLKMAYDFVYNMEWDYIFRTNASSYVDKRRLLNRAQDLPLNRLYCGKKVRLPAGEIISSGAGTFYSRDCIDVLRNTINEDHKMKYELDDVEEAAILRNKANIGVTDGGLRSDYTHGNFDDFIQNIVFTDSSPYHYRCRSMCKQGTVCEERKKEPIAFDKLFKYLIERK